MGFALGWNYLMKYLIVTPNNVNAAGKDILSASPLQPTLGSFSLRASDCLDTVRTNMHPAGIVINYWTNAVPTGVWMVIFILLSEHSLSAILRFHLIFDPSFPCQLSWCQGVRRTRILVLQYQSNCFDRVDYVRYYCRFGREPPT